ncbi:MAG: TorF family putative porin [Pontiellaceae bacterium]
MKKIVFLLSFVAFSSIVMAQDDIVMVDQGFIYSEGMTESTLEIGLASAYVDRGQVFNENPVMQPQLTLSQYGYSLNLWANFDFGKNMDEVSNSFSEFDVAFAYSLPVDVNQMSIDIGLINYNYPGNGNSSNPSTTELFLGTTFLSFQDIFTPSLTMYADIQEYPGVYFLLDIFAPYELSEFVGVVYGLSAGYGNTSYNDEKWGTSNPSNRDAGWTDFNFYVNASYEVSDTLTAAASLNYMTLNGSAYEDAASTLGYQADNILWGAVNLAYDF